MKLRRGHACSRQCAIANAQVMAITGQSCERANAPEFALPSTQRGLEAVVCKGAKAGPEGLPPSANARLLDPLDDQLQTCYMLAVARRRAAASLHTSTSHPAASSQAAAPAPASLLSSCSHGWTCDRVPSRTCGPRSARAASCGCRAHLHGGGGRGGGGVRWAGAAAVHPTARPHPTQPTNPDWTQPVGAEPSASAQPSAQSSHEAARPRGRGHTVLSGVAWRWCCRARAVPAP
jgi:hypothetical protein